MTKKDRKVIIFPGTFVRLISEAEQYVSEYQFHKAVEAFDEALQYEQLDEIADNILYTYAFSLYEIKETARAKELCAFVMDYKQQSMYYFEFVELYVSICMDLRHYEEARDIIEAVMKQGRVPQAQMEQFEHLQQLAQKLSQRRTSIVDEQPEEEGLDEEYEHLPSLHTEILDEPPVMQLVFLQQLMAANIRPYVELLKQLIEHRPTHPFIKSSALILLVEQQVDVEIEIEKFEQKLQVNPSKLTLPTQLPQFLKVQALVVQHTEQEPMIYEMCEQLIAKHSIVTYPFEWLHFHEEDVAFSYIDYVHTMFGEAREMDYEIVEFLQTLEKLAELH